MKFGDTLRQRSKCNRLIRLELCQVRAQISFCSLPGKNRRQRDFSWSRLVSEPKRRHLKSTEPWMRRICFNHSIRPLFSLDVTVLVTQLLCHKVRPYSFLFVRIQANTHSVVFSIAVLNFFFDLFFMLSANNRIDRKDAYSVPIYSKGLWRDCVSLRESHSHNGVAILPPKMSRVESGQFVQLMGEVQKFNKA